MGYECENCGATYQFGPAGESLTTIAVFTNDEEGEDYTRELCRSCYLELLEEFRAAVEAPDYTDENEDDHDE